MPPWYCSGSGSRQPQTGNLSVILGYQVLAWKRKPHYSSTNVAQANQSIIRLYHCQVHGPWGHRSIIPGFPGNMQRSTPHSNAGISNHAVTSIKKRLLAWYNKAVLYRKAANAIVDSFRVGCLLFYLWHSGSTPFQGPGAKNFMLLSPQVALTHVVGGFIRPLAYKEAEKG
ncbi:hypothetical protein BJV77DRAFT_806958 [Russula vinacea]|nr:hypothetical protein BJV77DRAFT_806958 [Russula vinacea]